MQYLYLDTGLPVLGQVRKLTQVVVLFGFQTNSLGATKGRQPIGYLCASGLREWATRALKG